MSDDPEPPEDLGRYLREDVTHHALASLDGHEGVLSGFGHRSESEFEERHEARIILLAHLISSASHRSECSTEQILRDVVAQLNDMDESSEGQP